MKKKIFLLSILLVVLLSSCSFVEDNKYQELTIINNTNLHIKFSVIKDTTSATKSRDFYAQPHNYLVDWAGFVMKQQLLSPSGTKSEKYMLDRMTYKFEKENCTATIFVCKSNTYSNEDDLYINKHSFVFSGDTTITIGSNGEIY